MVRSRRGNGLRHLPVPGGKRPAVLAACYEGRPVKLLPSLQYPEGPGLPAAVQASILDLYDPGRSRHILFNGKQASEDEFRGAFSSWSRNLRDGGRIGILLPPSDSPLLHSMLEEIRRKNPHVRTYAYSPVPAPGDAMQAVLRTASASASASRAPDASWLWTATSCMKTRTATRGNSSRPALRKG